MRPNSLFLSAALQNGHEELTRIASFFEKIQFVRSVTVLRAELSHEIDNRIIETLHRIGTGIIDFRLVEPQPTDFEVSFERKVKNLISKLSSSGSRFDFKAVHSKIELAHRDLSGTNIFFKADDESAGTRRLLLIFAAAYKVLDEGALLVIDELDASLHTQACEAVLALFSNRAKNQKGAQLLATTHDTNLMRSTLLRRDQIWFTEKDQAGATHLFPLSDVKTRQGDNIEKGYLQGRFGAIPFSGHIDDFFSSDS